MLLRILSLSLLLSILLSACRDDDEVISSNSVTINGQVQKGPFINGTNLVITELDNTLAATGKTFTTQITDNRGSFFIKTSRLDYPNLQLIATGFYYDEVQGEKSAAQLTLFALANVSADATINVNVLSHLEKDRIVYLIEQDMDFLKAKQQAQREILAIFGIARGNMANSELLDITQTGEENAILLAISAVLQSGNTVAGLSELLAEIITDLREDGTLDDESLKAILRQNAINLNLSAVRQNLVERYQELGLEVTIPNFEQFVDSDGDGILNKDDDNLPDEFVFAPVEEAMRNTVYQSETIVISGLPYPAIARVTQGKLIKNGRRIAGDTTYVSEGDSLSVELLASPEWNEGLTSTVQVGEYRTDFSVQVQAYPWASAIAGVAQQGPFVNGSAISLTEVDSTLAKTDKTHSSEIANSQGEYAIGGIEHHYPWALLEAKGYYFNLVSGSTSDSELNLVGYTDLATATNANVNVLTHLEHRRVKHLVNSGLSFAEAKQQALREVLAIFEIEEEVSMPAEQFDITQNNPEGANLLAISAMLQGYESTSALQELLTNISEDLETDGVLDGNLGSSLINNSFYLDLETIRQSITNKYQELGNTVAISDFEEYIVKFVDTSNFVLTRKIEYPTEGYYGENILAGTKTRYPKSRNPSYQDYFESKLYDIYAVLPVGAKLTVKISSKSSYDYGLTYPSNDDIWTMSEYNKAYPNTRILTAFKHGKFKVRLELLGDTKIEIYEQGVTKITRVKDIDVY